jgi:hypothetical protein
MSTLTETTHTAEFLLSEADGKRSREAVTVLSGQDLTAGAVVGKVKYGIGGMVTALTGTGNGTMTVLSAGPEVEVGDYIVKAISAATNNATFSVTSPSGKVLPNAVMAGGTCAYTSRHINFTLTDGGTDFAVGGTPSTFTVTVSTTAPVVIGGTGTGVMTALSLGPDAKPGTYKVINRAVVAEGGDFDVIGPDGDSIGRFLMGTTSAGTATFTSRQINFTLSDATDYILGNYFSVVVYNEVVAKVAAWNPLPTAYDGRHRVAGILYGDVDATGGDTAGLLISRDAEVDSSLLSYAAAITSGQKASAIAEMASRLGVIAR